MSAVNPSKFLQDMEIFLSYQLIETYVIGIYLLQQDTHISIINNTDELSLEQAVDDVQLLPRASK